MAIRGHNSQHSAPFSSDPQTLTLEVCPVIGTVVFQPQSWINENNNTFTITIYNFISSS
jgi:hypothetical protein